MCGAVRGPPRVIKSDRSWGTGAVALVTQASGRKTLLIQLCCVNKVTDRLTNFLCVFSTFIQENPYCVGTKTTISLVT